MTDKFSVKEVCGEYKFYEEGNSFPLTEKQILAKLNENEQSKMMIATLRNIVLEEEDLEEEIKSLKEQNDAYFKNINNLILDNMILKNEIIVLRERDDVIRNYLYNNEYMTLEKYNEIIDDLYEKFKKKKLKHLENG